MFSLWIVLTMVRPEDTVTRTLSSPRVAARMQLQANLTKLDRKLDMIAAQRGYRFEAAKPKCPYCKPGKEGACCDKVIAKRGGVALVMGAKKEAK